MFVFARVSPSKSTNPQKGSPFCRVLALEGWGVPTSIIHVGICGYIYIDISIYIYIYVLYIYMCVWTYLFITHNDVALRAPLSKLSVLTSSSSGWAFLAKQRCDFPFFGSNQYLE